LQARLVQQFYLVAKFTSGCFYSGTQSIYTDLDGLDQEACIICAGLLNRMDAELDEAYARYRQFYLQARFKIDVSVFCQAWREKASVH